MTIRCCIPTSGSAGLCTLLLAVAFLIFVAGMRHDTDTGHGHKDVVILTVCCERVCIPRIDASNYLTARSVDYEYGLIAKVNAVVSRVVPNFIAADSRDRGQGGACSGIEDHTTAGH